MSKKYEIFENETGSDLNEIDKNNLPTKLSHISSCDHCKNKKHGLYCRAVTKLGLKRHDHEPSHQKHTQTLSKKEKYFRRLPFSWKKRRENKNANEDICILTCGDSQEFLNVQPFEEQVLKKDYYDTDGGEAKQTLLKTLQEEWQKKSGKRFRKEVRKVCGYVATYARSESQVRLIIPGAHMVTTAFLRRQP